MVIQLYYELSKKAGLRLTLKLHFPDNWHFLIIAWHHNGSRIRSHPPQNIFLFLISTVLHILSACIRATNRSKSTCVLSSPATSWAEFSAPERNIETNDLDKKTRTFNCYEYGYLVNEIFVGHAPPIPSQMLHPQGCLCQLRSNRGTSSYLNFCLR